MHVFDPPPHLQLHLADGPRASKQARVALAQLVVPAPSPEFVDDVLLMASELVSNCATLGGNCELSVWFVPEQSAVRVEVIDQSASVPTLPDRREPSEITGRGLRIVDALATAWGVTMHSSGKSVWFEKVGPFRAKPTGA